MSNTQSYIGNLRSKVLLAGLLLILVFLVTGCGVDNTAINRAFANSSIMDSIHTELQKQTTFVDELRRRGVITVELATALNSEINEITKAVQTLTSGGTVTSPAPNTTADPSATPPPVEINGDYNNFIGTVLRSMTYFRDGSTDANFRVVKGLDDTTAAQENVAIFQDRLDIFQGYPTKLVLEKAIGEYSDANKTKYDFSKNNNSNYKGLAGYNNPSKNLEPLKPFGDLKDSNSPIKSLVVQINNMSSIQVCYINPDKVRTSSDLVRLKSELSAAASGKMAASDLKTNFFVEVPNGKVNLSAKPLKDEDAYHVYNVEVRDRGVHVATYQMYKLDEDAIRAACGGALQESDLSSGVFIGNYFFVTKYPVAVFRGFERSASVTSEYLPVFTHPYF